MPTIMPFLTPMSAWSFGDQLHHDIDEDLKITLYIPDQSMMRALVMTRSKVSWDDRLAACPIPSRIVFPIFMEA